MPERPYELLDLTSAPPARVGDDVDWIPVRRMLGITAFGANAYVGARAGDRVIEEHDELGTNAGGHEELYVVVAGRATFTVAGDAFDAPAGTTVLVRERATRRGAIAAEPGTVVLVVGATGDGTFAPSAWEYAFASDVMARDGDAEAAVGEALAGLEVHPDEPSLLYNLACFESLTGEHEQALVHIRRAVEVDPRALEWLADDPDLDPIRELEGFPI